MVTPPLALLRRRSEPHSRSVLADWHEEHGKRQPARLGVALWLIAIADAGAAAAADDAAADDAAAAIAAIAAAAIADAADADADAGVDARIKTLNSLLKKEPDMREGLKVVQVTGAYYGYAVTRVGWLRRVDGDEYELLPGAVTVMRTGEHNLAGIDLLASEGPGQRYQCSEPAKASEEIHRLLVRRSVPANEKAWAKVVPRPKDWAERES